MFICDERELRNKNFFLYAGSILWLKRFRIHRYEASPYRISFQYFGYLGNEDVDYINNLPEEARMVEITSNIWGTKFKIQGLHTSLPPLLGQV